MIGNEILFCPLRYRDFKEKIILLIYIVGKHYVGYSIKDQMKNSFILGQVFLVRNNEYINKEDDNRKSEKDKFQDFMELEVTEINDKLFECKEKIIYIGSQITVWASGESWIKKW